MFVFVTHYKFIKYAPVCYYKYASIVPVQTFYFVILIRVNKKVLPIHNFPLPLKNFQLATCLEQSFKFSIKVMNKTVASAAQFAKCILLHAYSCTTMCSSQLHKQKLFNKF